MRSIKTAAIALLLVSPSLPAAAGQSNGLTVQAGETWIFRIENGQPAGARKVDRTTEPQEGELKVTVDPSKGTMMNLKNNSDRWYNYRAFLTGKPGSKGKPTTVCTLGAGLGAYEFWPNTIPAIRIADFTETEEGMMVCK